MRSRTPTTRSAACLGALAAFLHRDSFGRPPPRLRRARPYGRPTLYEAARSYAVHEASTGLYACDAAPAVDDLQREPAARIFARAHEGVTPDERVPLPQRALAARAHRGRLRGFDWDD